jgi:hypothetical protein
MVPDVHHNQTTKTTFLRDLWLCLTTRTRDDPSAASAALTASPTIRSLNVGWWEMANEADTCRKYVLPKFYSADREISRWLIVSHFARVAVHVFEAAQIPDAPLHSENSNLCFN